jgi:hypothetical protein
LTSVRIAHSESNALRCVWSVSPASSATSAVLALENETLSNPVCISFPRYTIVSVPCDAPGLDWLSL